MIITENNIVGEIVSEDYRAASIFQTAGIDFCCNGNRSILEACSDLQVDTNLLIQNLEKALQSIEAGGLNFNELSPEFLAEYIEKKHHRYVEMKIPEIRQFLNKMATVHGKRHPELLEIYDLFNASADELTAHMKKEELILFPHIKKLVVASNNGEKAQSTIFESVESPIALMHQEHDTEGDRFRKIETLSNNYTAPEDGCSTYKVAFALLKEFQEDLHKHIHLENNILFPKAIALEKVIQNN